MTQANTALYNREMRLGHEARELRGDHREAIQHYLAAQDAAPNSMAYVMACQATGVSYRVIGDLPKARLILSRAMSDALENGALRLAANIARDLSKVYHAEAISFHEKGNLRDALSAFHTADKLMTDSARDLRKHHDEYGALASDSFRGLLYLEWGQHVGIIGGSGMRHHGTRILREAVRGLKKIVYIPSGKTKRERTYEVNARINLMQASLFWALVGLPRALWLTRPRTENHGSWKRVIAALLGNRIYGMLKKRQSKN
jgi:hypothetical protein